MTVKKQLADFETDFAARKNLICNRIKPDTNYNLEIRCQASNRSGMNSKPQGEVSAATGELTSKLCSSVARMKHLTLSHNLI